MKKLIIVVLVCILLTIGALSCTEPETTTPTTTQPTTSQPTTQPTTAAEPISLVINDHNPPGTPPAVVNDLWAEYVEQQSGGRLDLEVIHGAALFTGDEVYGQLLAGGCDGGMYIVDREDGFLLNLVLTLPFLGWPEQHFEDAFYTLMDEFPEYAAEWDGVTIISLMIMPGTQLNMADKIYATPEDIKGVKMFCAEASLVEIMNAVGATGVELPITDMAPSVQTGVVEGVFNHIPVCNVFGALELLPYHTMFGGGINFTPAFMCMSTDVLNGLPSDLQDLLRDTGSYWCEQFTIATAADIEASMAFCEENNHTFKYLTPAEIAEWRDVIQEDVINTWIDECEAAGLPGQAVYDRVMELIQEMS